MDRMQLLPSQSSQADGGGRGSAHTSSNVMGATRGGEDGACCGTYMGRGEEPDHRGGRREVREVFSEAVTFNPDGSWVGRILSEEKGTHTWSGRA